MAFSGEEGLAILRWIEAPRHKPHPDRSGFGLVWGSMGTGSPDDYGVSFHRARTIQVI
jgi:hypothetical protein